MESNICYGSRSIIDVILSYSDRTSPLIPYTLPRLVTRCKLFQNQLHSISCFDQCLLSTLPLPGSIPVLSSEFLTSSCEVVVLHSTRDLVMLAPT